MRAGRRFRVVLHAEQRQVAVAQALERRVIEVHVRELDFGLRQRIGINGEIVVMRRDLDLARVQLLHRMIATVMPELELERFAAERKTRKLMAEADAEDRLAPHEAADVIYCVGAWLGIAGAVREKDAVRL